MNINVLGIGCINCITLEKRTAEAIRKLSADAVIEKVTDYDQILSHGIVRTPGLVVNDKIEVQCRVPTVAQIENIIKAHMR